MSKILAIFVLASFSSFVIAEKPEENIAAIRAKMLELAGASAVECGLVQSGASSRVPWHCVHEAEKRGKAFWLAREARRTDSAVWILLARSPQGKRYAVFYTSNNAGQPEFAPHFDVHECKKPFEPVEDSFFGTNCGPDVP